MLMTNAQTLPMKAKDAEIKELRAQSAQLRTQAVAQAKAMADMQQAFFGTNGGA